MALIKLMGGYTPIPEGAHTFKIIDVTYSEEYGKVEVNMKTKDGLSHIERFTLIKNGGLVNEGALKAFSYFAKVALNDFTLDQIDHTALIGHFIDAVATHDVQPNRNKEGETVTFVHLQDFKVSKGFGGENQASKSYDLDDIFN